MEGWWNVGDGVGNVMRCRVRSRASGRYSCGLMGLVGLSKLYMCVLRHGVTVG